MIFSYDTAATVVLTAIVERLAEMPFLDYMRPRFLDRIGFSADAWCYFEEHAYPLSNSC